MIKEWVIRNGDTDIEKTKIERIGKEGGLN